MVLLGDLQGILQHPLAAPFKDVSLAQVLRELGWAAVWPFGRRGNGAPMKSRPSFGDWVWFFESVGLIPPAGPVDFSTGSPPTLMRQITMDPVLIPDL
jgi:hypothetical protein